MTGDWVSNIISVLTSNGLLIITDTRKLGTLKGSVAQVADGTIITARLNVVSSAMRTTSKPVNPDVLNTCILIIPNHDLHHHSAVCTTIITSNAFFATYL
jgi:hypothetical protein